MVHAAATNLVVGKGTTFCRHSARVMSLDVINALCMEDRARGGIGRDVKMWLTCQHGHVDGVSCEDSQ